jgi:hypothetical protein
MSDHLYVVVLSSKVYYGGPALGIYPNYDQAKAVADAIGARVEPYIPLQYLLRAHRMKETMARREYNHPSQN